MPDAPIKPAVPLDVSTHRAVVHLEIKIQQYLQRMQRMLILLESA